MLSFWFGVFFIIATGVLLGKIALWVNFLASKDVRSRKSVFGREWKIGEK